MKEKNLFFEYLQQPTAKTLERIAFEAGAGSVDYLRQIGRGTRTAAPKLARGIEVATGGGVTCKQLRPDDYEEIWGTPSGVYERMRQAEVSPNCYRNVSRAVIAKGVSHE